MKELTIKAPDGYVIDKDKSTSKEVVFKKVTYPETWEEYLATTGSKYVITVNGVVTTTTDKFTFVMPSLESAEKLRAFAKLVALNEVWTKDCQIDPDTCYSIYMNGSYPLPINIRGTFNFPNLDTAEKFINCFKDLLMEAKGLY